MKLFALLLFRKAKDDEPPAMLASHYDLSSFGMFQRKAVGDFITMFSRQSAKKCERGTRTQVEQDKHVLYTHALESGLVAVLTTNSEYPARVAFSCLIAVMQDFTDSPHAAGWDAPTASSTDNAFQYPGVERIMKEYADPSNADKVMRLQRDIDDVKTEMHMVVSALLDRGTKLDDLVQTSGDLKDSSKRFYSATKKTGCCSSLSG